MSVTEIVEAVRALSPSEQAQVKALINSLPDDMPARSYNTHESERAWIEQHRDEYLNQWVALDGDRLLAHGTDAREVYLAARATSDAVPYVERVKPSDRLPFGGW
ncbi:MAG: DUF5678 domain-containing protein [Pyrinomonadaceae bacterium MAG19_C2-C3]|nr:DUF5678 domain-containing protein [Pyrinomonadaceae bacterium MAG19_C2-C3]